MSVLIKGMEMPTTCVTCPCADDESRFCRAAKEYIPMLGHPKFCPLIYVPPHGGWIPVTERVPENLTSVIVHRKDGGIFIWEYFDTSPTDECWIDDSMNTYSFYDVTHWMPLPQPPKEE